VLLFLAMCFPLWAADLYPVINLPDSDNIYQPSHELIYRGGIVCSQEIYNQFEESNLEEILVDLKEYSSIKKVIESMMCDLKKDQPIYKITLAFSSLEDEEFKTFYDKFLMLEPSLKQSLLVMDFSHNSLGKNSPEVIWKILNLFPNLAFLNVSETSITEELLISLINFLREKYSNSAEYLTQMRKIIFMGNTAVDCFINHSVYKDLIPDLLSKESLPEDWDKIHKHFHKKISTIPGNKLLETFK
jgi:hypothetical protein